MSDAVNSKLALKKLKELLGGETYEAVIELLAGTTVYFPANGGFTDLEERNLKIKDDFFSGDYEVTDLARKYDLSVSRIYKIIQTK